MSTQILKTEVEGSDAFVLTGTYDPKSSSVITEKGKTRIEDMDYRAMWSYLRLHMGKGHADWVIKSEKEEIMEKHPKISNVEMKDRTGKFLRKLIRERSTDRELQFIIAPSGDLNIIKAVASTNHLLIPPSQVIESAQRVLPINPTYDPDYGSLMAELEDLGTFRINFGLDPGNILTRRAIRVGFGLKVTICTNPLSWIDAGENEKFFTKNIWERYGDTRSRILRVDRPTSLDDRILEAYEASLDGKDIVKQDVQRAKETKISDYEAKILGSSFPISFGAGKKTVKAILERYNSEKANGTLWGLAMAISYVAKHGDRRANAKSFTKNLAGAGAGYLWIEDKKAVVNQAEKWLKDTKKIDLKEWL